MSKVSKTPVKQTTVVAPEVIWRAKGKEGVTREIPITEMSEGHLQRALWSVQKRYSELSNKLDNLLKLEELLEQEANNRGINLEDFDPTKAKKHSKV